MKNVVKMRTHSVTFHKFHDFGHCFTEQTGQKVPMSIPDPTGNPDNQ